MTRQIDEHTDVLQKAQELTNNMLAVAQPNAIFGEPVQMGGQTILTTSEVGAAMGVGKIKAASGGGGTSSGRPVAVVTADSNGVTIRPVLDVTKIALGLLATVGSFLMIWRKLKMQGRG